MSIAFDFVGTNVGSGTKTYNINFLKEIELLSLREDIIIFLTKNYFQQLKKQNPKIRYMVKPNFFSNIFFRLFWMQFILPFELKINGVKKLYSPMNFCPIFLKIFKIKIILTLHSNLPWVYFHLMPGNILRNFFTKKLMELSINSCNLLLVDSHFAKKEITNILKINIKKIKVVYLGIDKKFLSNDCKNNFIESFNYNEKYIVSVLSCVKYHNILNMLKAFKILVSDNNYDIKLVLVLQILDTEYFSEINKYINTNFDKNKIIIINDVKSESLPNLYKHSQLYIFSSYCEVFGLTSLEAMSQGCPILISNTSALPEINDIAADYFDPDNVMDIKDKMQKIISDEKYKNELVEKGQNHFKKFTWNNNVNITLDHIYNLN